MQRPTMAAMAVNLCKRIFILKF